MKIALIGASGFVGSHVMMEALSRNHQITAMVRHPENIKITHPNLMVHEGDVLQPEMVAPIVSGHDAVISTYNPGWENPRIYQEYLEGAQSIQRGARLAGVGRLLVVGGAGSLVLPDGTQLVDSPDFPAAYLDGAKAARDYLNILKTEKDLDWTFLSPAILMNPAIRDGRTGSYRVGNDSPVFDAKGQSRISVEDLAMAIMDEMETPRFLKKRFTVGY